MAEPQLTTPFPILPPDGPLKELMIKFRDLHRRAGRPGSRRLAAGSAFSHTTMHEMIRSSSVPKWPVLHAALSNLCDHAPNSDKLTIIREFELLWQAADDAQYARGDSAIIAVGVDTSGAEPPVDKASGAVVSDAISGTQGLVGGGISPRNSSFIGRKDLLRQLRVILVEQRQIFLPPISLYGLGGVGKSQVAIEYTYLNREEYGLIWWIPSDDDPSIRRSLVDLARRLHLPTSDDLDTTIANTLEALRDGAQGTRWLLIYDNAPEPESLTKYLPGHYGNVIITSRSHSWRRNTTAIEVGVFTPEESLRLLLNRWSDLTPEAAQILADRLGHLPLALEQAAAVHAETGMPVEDYMQALSDSPSTILREGTPSHYLRSVDETLRLSILKLREVSPRSALLLELGCILGPKPIAVSLLLRGRNGSGRFSDGITELLRDDLSVRRAVRDLGRFALGRLDTGRDLLSIHNLIRDLVREGMSDSKRDDLRRQSHLLLAHANPGQPDNPATWPLHAQIAPHVVSTGLIYSDKYDIRTLVLDQVRYAYVSGDDSAGPRLVDTAVETWVRHFGPEDELTLLANFHLANALRARGDNIKARALNIDTLERMQRVFGVEHEYTLATSNSHAADLRLLGKFSDALDLDNANVHAHERVLGRADPATIRALGNLAVDQRLQGHFADAIATDKRSIEIRAEVYGDDHPRTLYAHICLARDYYGAGDYTQALKLIEEKLPTYADRLPLNHRDVLLAGRMRVILLRKLGQVGAATFEAASLHELHMRVFGRRHEHTQAAGISLSNCRCANGEYELAHLQAEADLTAYTETFGDEHPFTQACLMTTGVIVSHLGDLAAGLSRCSTALDGMQMNLGRDHPHTLCCAANKATLMAADGDVRAAERLNREILHVSRRVLSATHPNTLLAAANLSIDLQDLGRIVESSKLQKETFPGLQRAFGAENFEGKRMAAGKRSDFDIEVSPS